MIDAKIIEKINELARKKKSTGLTPAEEKERARLREIYLEQFRGQLRQQLDQIEIVDDEEPRTKH
ncbi:DUF896 domain-containing protein [Marinicrinis sediminis]|uniref:UPF0291 protein ACFSUC_15775 n=1 Tax=Marinicrinis sediminis TaxID=1652465 RepID=A0ABW5RER7_9BACL